MWLQSRLFPDSPAYNSSYVYRLRGPLDLGALRSSFESVLSRHEVLRTKFIWDGEELYQEPQPLPDLEFPVDDLSALPEPSREQRAHEVIRDEKLRPFRFDGSPLVRLRLLRMARDHHILCISMHHIVTDGWSQGILWRDLNAFYAAALSASRAELPELPIQFADYAAWHRRWVETEIAPKQLSFWTERLKGAKPVDLPLDRPRPARHGFVSRRLHSRIEAGFYENLSSFGKLHRVTPFMTLLAGYQALLHRVTAERDFVVGVPTANRTRVETHDLIGFFVNVLSIRAEVSGDLSFVDLLQRVRSATLDAYDRQEVPLELVLRELGPERDSGLAPLFRTLFVMQNATQHEFALPGVSAERIRTDIGMTHFDQSWVISRAGGGIAIDVAYNPELFDASTVERTVRSFECLVRAALQDPTRKIAELPLMSVEERRRIVEEWNRTETDYPRDTSIHELVRECARRFPLRTAVVCGRESVTYRELDRRSDGVAARLAARGVRLGDRVAVAAERSIPAVVGILGILKAGGVYVPIDPACPPARVRTMLEQCGIRSALARSKWNPGGLGDSLDVLPLEEPLESEAPAALPEVRGDAAAYVNFTSGSTGRPKAIEVTHRNVIRLLHSPDFATLGPDRVVLHLSPLSFDASTFEVWGPLLHGGTCVVLSDRAPTIDALERAIRENRVTTVWLTAALFHAVVDEAPQILKSVQEVLTGGERVSPDHVRKALAHLPGTVLRNAYGPTETTTFATSYRIPGDFPEGARDVPIGRPVCNARVYILDQYRNPVPIGVPGEIYIGGDGVAKAYVADERLTSEKFIPDPFADPPARMYRTGDKARFREDGTIEFLGRLDRQVKIRGFRIEPEEVERALLAHPEVRQSIVEVEENGCEKRLVAFAAPAEGGSPTEEELVDFLRDRLPEYMIPARLHVIQRIPISPTGKVDRSALPRFRPVDPASEAVATGTESVLQQIWEGLFRVRPIRPTDNFFHLGGHSILAVRLASRIEARFGLRFPLSAIFEAPTIRQQARWIDAREDRQPTRMVKVQDGQRRPPLLFVPGGDGFVVRLRRLARAIGPDQPVYGFQEDWEADSPAYASFEEIAAKNVQDIKRHGLQGPYYLAGFCTGSLVALEMARQLREEGREVAMLTLIYPAAPRQSRRFRSGLAGWVGNWREGLHRLWAHPPEQILAAIAFGGFMVIYLAEKLRGRKNGFMHRLGRGIRLHAIARMLYRGNVYPGKITILAPQISYHRRFPVGIWKKLTNVGVDFRPMDLSHQDVLGARGIPRVARELSKLMTECGPSPSDITAMGDPGLRA